jgi:hypothetical protein
LLGYFAPLVSIGDDKVENEEIFLDTPLSSFDTLVEVIEPVLPALLGRFEVLSLSLKEYKP